MQIEVKNLSYIYSAGLPYETKALSDISFNTKEGDFVALVGCTGSGKTTLVELLAGLIKPSEGSIFYDGKDLFEKGSEVKQLKHKIGIVFQYPEYQLFEETILKDVCFGPKNLGYTEEECEQRARHALSLVGINADKLADQSPFSLSGGQKRRVAIAGVLAMDPEVLILDEPTAGLDPKGHRDILEMIKKIKEEKNLTIFLVSHNMDDVIEFANKVIVLKRGTIRLIGSPREVFENVDEVISAGLDLPEGPAFAQYLYRRGVKLGKTLSFLETADEIEKYLRK